MEEPHAEVLCAGVRSDSHRSHRQGQAALYRFSGIGTWHEHSKQVRFQRRSAPRADWTRRGFPILVHIMSSGEFSLRNSSVSRNKEEEKPHAAVPWSSESKWDRTGYDVLQVAIRNKKTMMRSSWSSSSRSSGRWQHSNNNDDDDDVATFISAIALVCLVVFV